MHVIQYWNRVNFLSLKNRFFGLTGFLAYGLPVLILTKTAQAYLYRKLHGSRSINEKLHMFGEIFLFRQT